MDSEQQDLLEYLLYSIKHSFVHSSISQGYSLYAIGNSIEDCDFLLSVKYSHTDNFDVWCEYEIFFNKIPTTKVILPLNSTIKDEQSIAILEIFKMCSNKVIAQERLAKKNMFLRSFVNEPNTH